MYTNDMTDAKKLEAVETYLSWNVDPTNAEELLDILNRIHMVVFEDTILPHPAEGNV
jgi:hypothetical protein